MDDLEPSIEYSDTGYPVAEPVPIFAISLRPPNKIRLINVGPDLVRAIQDRIQQLVPVDTFGYVIFKDQHVASATSFTGRFNIYDLILDKCYFEKTTDPSDGSMLPLQMTKEDMTLIKVAFCRVLGTLFCYGYDVVIASDLSRDATAHSTVFFRLRDPRHDYLPLHYYSHKFICIAPHGTDSILLINIPKVAVEPILKLIHLTWKPGIKSKQTLADDERSVSVVISLKLYGSPWSPAVYNSGKATIQARTIILEVARVLSAHKWRFAINVNFNGSTDSFFFQWCPSLDGLEEMCALILSRYDRLRLLHVPSSLAPVVRDCINKYWYLQLIKHKEYHGTNEFRLGGCPWWADGNDAVESRYFISSLIGTIRASGWEVAGTLDFSRHNNDKSTFLLRQVDKDPLKGETSSTITSAHMCISFNKTNRIRLIVGSSDISEEKELILTTTINEIIKLRWVALGPRNYGKSIEWKLEGDPWDTEGLYSDQTRGVYLLCLLLEAIQPLGWRLVSSADISSKNLDANERGYSLVGKPEDMHTWFFVYDEYMRRDDVGDKKESEKHQSHQQSSGLNNNSKQIHSTSEANHQPQHQQYNMNRGGGMLNRGSASVPNLDDNVPKKMSPTPPTYKSSNQHNQSAQHSINNHHPQHHQQQYAGKEVNPFLNGQSLTNQNALPHNNASHLHQLPYDQQKLENHQSHVHHSHATYQANPIMNNDFNSASVVKSERVGSTRVNYPHSNYNQMPSHGSHYISGWVHQQQHPQQHMMNYGQHPNQYYYQKSGNAPGYGHTVHPGHHHSHHYSQQNPPIPQHHHHGYDSSGGLLHQRHQSRSVPSVHDAVSGQSNTNQPRNDSHASRNSLHETTRLNRSSVSLRGNSMHDDLSSHGMDHFQPYSHNHRHPGGGFQQQQQFSTFIGAPFNQQVQQHPCMAHQPKRQNQRGVFMRQASAPDIPPEHSLDNETDVYSEGFNNQHEFRSRSQGNLRRPTISKMHSIDDIGYKSEGSNNRYKRSSSGGPGEFFQYNQELPHNAAPFHQCMGTTNPMYRRSGGDLTQLPPPQRPHSSFHGNVTATRNNGYLSDGEGYAIRNRRISKSGRYGGSHGSSPGANGPTAPFAYETQIEGSRKSPYQQHVGLRQRHDARNISGKNMGYHSSANERSGDETRDDDDEDDDEEEDDDGYIGDRIPNHQHRRSSGNHHVIANISTTPADTDDLDDIEDEADDNDENDDNIEDERDMEDTNEDGTTASATATVVAASVTAAAIKTTKTSNGSQNETDLIVSYSTYQSQTAAIGNSSNVSKTNRAKIKQSKQMSITNTQGNLKQSNNDVRGADSSCEEIFGTTIDSTPSGCTNNPKIVRNNKNGGCKIDKDEGRLSTSKKPTRSGATNNVKNNRNNTRQGIYSSDQSSTGADQAPLPPPPPDQGLTSSQSSGLSRRRRGQMERADSQHSSSGGGGYRSEPGNCTSCGSGGKELFIRAEDGRRSKDGKTSKQCDKGRSGNVEEGEIGSSTVGGSIIGSGGRCSSAGSCGIRLTPDGYPSEESLNDSPLHASCVGIGRDNQAGSASVTGGGYASGGSGSAGSLGPGCCRQQHGDIQNQRVQDKYGHLHPNHGYGGSVHAPPQLQSRQSSSSLGSGGRSSSAGTRPQPLQPRNQYSDPVNSNQTSCVGPSKSLNSFQRQESAASFHSGTSAQSTQSAPTCPNHVHHKYPPQGQQITSAQSLHHHSGNTGVKGGKHSLDKRSLGPHYQRNEGAPPPLPQHCVSKQPPPPPPHLGMLPPPPSQPANFESCSTQSSSSSASAPPDYATYPGFPPNPNYDKGKHPPPPPPHQTHCAQSNAMDGFQMAQNFGSKSPSSRRYAQDYHNPQQPQHQSRRKPFRDHSDPIREQHSSFPTSTIGGPGYHGGYLQEHHIDFYRGSDSNRGRPNQYRSLSASRGAGKNNNQYHQSTSWHTTNLQQTNTSKNGDVLRKSNELYYVGEFYG